MKNHPPTSAYRWCREYLAITSLQSYLSTLMPCSEVAENAQNVSGKGIRREVREKGKLARQALKAADTKPFLYKSSAQFWPESLAATKQHSGTQRKSVACKEQIQLVAALGHPLPFGGYLGSYVEQSGGLAQHPVGRYPQDSTTGRGGGGPCLGIAPHHQEHAPKLHGAPYSFGLCPSEEAFLSLNGERQPLLPDYVTPSSLIGRLLLTQKSYPHKIHANLFKYCGLYSNLFCILLDCPGGFPQDGACEPVPF